MSSSPTRAANLQAEQVISRRSELMFGLFARIFRRALVRDFHALRVSRSSPPPPADTPRLILYSNHPSWWDAVAFVVLAESLFRGRPGFVPIEVSMLRRYRFMERIGAFGIEPAGRAGAAVFLAIVRRIMQQSEGLILVTAQGRFADARERPLELRPGVAHLARWAPNATFVPLALDYAFWNERRPELLVRFGAPIPAAALAGLPVPKSLKILSRELEQTMDALAAEAIRRDAAAFHTLAEGRAGVGGIYDIWRRGRAYWRGETFSPAHSELP